MLKQLLLFFKACPRATIYRVQKEYYSKEYIWKEINEKIFVLGGQTCGNQLLFQDDRLFCS